MNISARRRPGQEDTDARLSLSFELAVDATSVTIEKVKLRSVSASNLRFRADLACPLTNLFFSSCFRDQLLNLFDAARM